MLAVGYQFGSIVHKFKHIASSMLPICQSSIAVVRLKTLTRFNQQASI